MSNASGAIVGAALVSHHPGLAQTEEFRIRAGDGADSDLVAGYGRLRARMDAVRPDTLMIIDTHWFTTGFHLVDAGVHYRGTYVSDEMPWYLADVSYDYAGDPELAQLCQVVGEERGVMAMAVAQEAIVVEAAVATVATVALVAVSTRWR